MRIEIKKKKRTIINADVSRRLQINVHLTRKLNLPNFCLWKIRIEFNYFFYIINIETAMNMLIEWIEHTLFFEYFCMLSYAESSITYLHELSRFWFRWPWSSKWPFEVNASIGHIKSERFSKLDKRYASKKSVGKHLFWSKSKFQNFARFTDAVSFRNRIQYWIIIMSDKFLLNSYSMYAITSIQ